VDIIDDAAHQDDGHGNSGPGWPIAAERQSTLPDPQFAHPTWCDVDGSCTAPDALRRRGISELEVDRWRRDQHWSAPRVVGKDDEDRQGEATFTFALTRWVYQPVTDEPDQLIMTISYVEYLMIIAAPVSGRQALVMAEALREYAGAWIHHG
jgi:hypothetical protein